MSWFTEMAEKAESFLNKMDQVTAAAVSKTTSIDGTDCESTATIQPSLVTHQPKYTPDASVSKPATHSRTSSLSSSFSTVSSRDIHGISGDSNHGHNLYGISHNSPFHGSSDHGNPNMTLSSDEKIFEYLNSTSDTSTPTASSLSGSSRGHPARKLSDDDTSIEVVSNTSDSGGKTTPISLPNEAISDRRLSSSSNQRSSPFMESSTVSEPSPFMESSTVSKSDADEPKRMFEEGTRVVSSLREEMQSLTGEISRLNKRTIELETANKRLTKRMENWKKQMASSDEALRESRVREEMKKDVIVQREGRIELLESEVEALNRDRVGMLSRIDSLEKERSIVTSEKESLREESMRRSGGYEETIRRLSEELAGEREAKSQIQCDFMSRIQSLEDDQNQLVNDLTSTQNELRNERALTKEMSNDLTSTQNELRSERTLTKEMGKRVEILQGSLSELERDYDAYKDKATKTLASKDQLIRQLHTGSHMDDHTSHSQHPDTLLQYDVHSLSHPDTLLQYDVHSLSHPDTPLQHEVHSLKHSDTPLQHEVHSLKHQLDELQLKYDSVQELERTKCQEISSLLATLSDVNERLSSLSEELVNEKRGREALLQDYIQLQEEYKYSKEEGKKLREGLNQRLNDREMEIDKLRKQLTSKASTQTLTGSPVYATNPTSSSSEMESRIKSLTDSLIQKQAMVESLNAERNSLTLQLERCESRLRSYQDYNPGSPVSVTIGMVHSSSASSLVNRYRPLMEESVQDGQVARGVKRAYSQLDYFSIRLGQFFRVYPGARIMVLFYILVLHLWVFYLLFTYEPEIHSDL